MTICGQDFVIFVVTHLIDIIGMHALLRQPEAHVLVAGWILGIWDELGDFAGLELRQETIICIHV